MLKKLCQKDLLNLVILNLKYAPLVKKPHLEEIDLKESTLKLESGFLTYQTKKVFTHQTLNYHPIIYIKSRFISEGTKNQL